MPVRRCAGCRRPDTVAGLVRVAVAADGTLVVDARRRLPGRGLNVHPLARCVERALQPRPLARALRIPSAPDTAALAARVLAAAPPTAGAPTAAPPPAGAGGPVS